MRLPDCRRRRHPDPKKQMSSRWNKALDGNMCVQCGRPNKKGLMPEELWRTSRPVSSVHQHKAGRQVDLGVPSRALTGKLRKKHFQLHISCDADVFVPRVSIHRCGHITRPPMQLRWHLCLANRWISWPHPTDILRVNIVDRGTMVYPFCGYTMGLPHEGECIIFRPLPSLSPHPSVLHGSDGVVNGAPLVSEDTRVTPTRCYHPYRSRSKWSLSLVGIAHLSENDGRDPLKSHSPRRDCFHWKKLWRIQVAVASLAHQ